MKRKIVILSMMMFLMGTGSCIYFLPMQEAIFVEQMRVEKSALEFTSVFQSPQLRSVGESVKTILTILAQLVGVVALAYVVIAASKYIVTHYIPSYVYFTPQKAKSLRWTWDDIL